MNMFDTLRPSIDACDIQNYLGIITKREAQETIAGSIASVLLLEHSQKKAFFANVADSKIVMSYNGKAVQLSKDHLLSDASEQQRISKAGFEIKKEL